MIGVVLVCIIIALVELSWPCHKYPPLFSILSLLLFNIIKKSSLHHSIPPPH
jgi:hypothetical protein